jgi:hypothetical protein
MTKQHKITRIITVDDRIPGSEQAHHSKQMFEYVIRAFFTIIAYLLYVQL